MQRETLACRDLEDHQEQQGNLEKMVPLGTLVTWDQEESPGSLDQRETLEDLALAILDQEEIQVTEVTRATVDPVAAEETVVRREILEIKELRESQVNQDLLGSLDQEDQEESLVVMDIQAQKEILDLPNAT